MSDDRWLATTLSVGAAVVGAVVAFRRQLAQRAPVAQSLQHQVHVVTGANTGLGFATSRELAKRGASVVMVCRSREKCDAAAGRIRRALAVQRGAVAGSVTTATCDLASRDSIAAFVAEALPAAVPGGAIDALVNNAGLMSGKKFGEDVVDGVDATVRTNHCGPAALTLRVLAAFDVRRCVVVASRLEKRGRVGEVLEGGTPDASAYAVSKQMNLLFARELAKRRPETLTVSCTPGMVNTELGRYHPLFALAAPLRHALLPTPAAGCGSIVHAATAPDLAPGGYYAKATAGGFEAVAPSPDARDDALAARLWDRTAEWNAAGGGGAALFARVPLDGCARGEDL